MAGDSPGSFHCHPPTPTRVPGRLGQEMPPDRHRGDRGSQSRGSLSPELCKHIRTRSPSAQDGGTTAAIPPSCNRENDRHPERSGHGRAAQRSQPAPRSQASGAEERPAWLSARRCGEEKPTLIWRQRPPGHLQFSMLPPLLLLLRAPGAALCHNAPLSPLQPSAGLPPCCQPLRWFVAMRPA